MSDAQSLVERLRAEAQRLSGSSLDNGCAGCGIAANVADEAATLIEQLDAAGERVAAEGRQAQGAYEIIRDERDWWQARAEKAEAALRKVRNWISGNTIGWQPALDLIEAAFTPEEEA